MDRSAAAKSRKRSALSLGDSGTPPGSARRSGGLYPEEYFIGIGFRGAVGGVPREIPSAWWTCFQLPCGSGGGGSPASERLWR
jgi:hypothetical protein